MSDKLFVKRKGKVSGPFTREVLKEGLRNGKLKETDLVRVGEGEWRTVSDVFKRSVEKKPVGWPIIAAIVVPTVLLIVAITALAIWRLSVPQTEPFADLHDTGLMKSRARVRILEMKVRELEEQLAEVKGLRDGVRLETLNGEPVWVLQNSNGMLAAISEQGELLDVGADDLGIRVSRSSDVRIPFSRVIEATVVLPW